MSKKVVFNLLNFKYAEIRENLTASSPKVLVQSHQEVHHGECDNREEASAKGCSQMPVTSRDSQTETSVPPKKTSWERAVLVIVLIIVALIGAFSANMPLVEDTLNKLIENL